MWLAKTPALVASILWRFGLRLSGCLEAQITRALADLSGQPLGAEAHGGLWAHLCRKA